eukprot:2217095-Amphidinium_carterae.2
MDIFDLMARITGIQKHICLEHRHCLRFCVMYTCVYGALAALVFQAFSRESLVSMDSQRDAHLLAPHNTTGGDVRQLDSSTALDLEDALPEASEKAPLDTVPGGPVDPLEEQEPGSP